MLGKINLRRIENWRDYKLDLSMFWIAIILLVNLNKFASLVETEKQGSQHSLHLFFQEIREQAFPRFWEPQTQRPHWKKEPYNLFKNRINIVLSVIWEAMGAFHLVKHSENSGSRLNHGKTFFRFPRLQNSKKKWNCSEGRTSRLASRVPISLVIFTSSRPTVIE